MNKDSQLQRDIEGLKKIGIDAFDEKYAPKAQMEVTPDKQGEAKEYVNAVRSNGLLLLC